ncbi:hypothetical protein [Alteromonas sp. KUL49]|uniref:hypothetical protein n=1 Tax=Alteromonas sp. KUL49 TaxID=2480798 RepID=UPI00102F289A|nr:hypothetical protein [Alteromonas sp. KUL49]TAP39852.1 hypothetical protein EYS00_11135 [Alteromonas sp. KUL49]GEA11862.1 hypothetical protein KUL49_22370 [Alteromonas sp. KUL49]
MLGKQTFDQPSVAKGAVATTTVLLLTALLTGALIYALTTITSLTYQVHHHRKYFAAMSEIEFQINRIAEQLRQNSPEALELPTTTIVTETPLLGRNDAPLTHFTIEVASLELPLSVSQEYLRYPALLSLPSAHSTNLSDQYLSSMLSTMFNRKLEDFSPSYFPQVVISSQCDLTITEAVIWHHGNCDVTLSGDIGTFNAPLLIVIEGGDLNIDGLGVLWGLILLLDRRDLREPSATFSHGTALRGAVVSNVNYQIAGQTTFNHNVLKQLQQSSYLAKIIPVPGSWHDDIQ